MIAWGLGIYFSVLLLGYFGPPLYPKLYRKLRGIFDGEAPFVPYIILLIGWPLLLPIYLGVYLIVVPIIKLGDLHDQLLEWSENRLQERARRITHKKAQEEYRRQQHADKFL